MTLRRVIYPIRRAQGKEDSLFIIKGLMAREAYKAAQIQEVGILNCTYLETEHPKASYSRNIP